MYHCYLAKNVKKIILLILHRFDALENMTDGDHFLPNKSNGKIETQFTDVSIQISELHSQKRTL